MTRKRGLAANEVAVDKRTLAWLLLCALRYSIGRQSTASWLTSGALTSYLRHCEPERRFAIADELRRELLRPEHCGDPVCDVLQWRECLAALEAQP